MSRLTKRLQEGKALCIAECEKECTEGYYECHKCKPFADVLVKLADYEDIGTVEELQAYKNGSCTNNCSHYDNVIGYVRNKAIDDFAKRICDFGVYDHWGNTIDILAIAEDLKGE